MLIEDYFKEIEEIISKSAFIVTWNIQKDKRSFYIGAIQGQVQFVDQSILYIMEFVDVSRGVERYKYKYHYQDRENKMIFRYDMAPHFRNLITFPHHKHVRTENDIEKVIESSAPCLKEVLNEIELGFLN